MRGILNNTIQAGLALVMIDAFIVMAAMLQIAQGISTPHIPFWDAQIKFIINLLGI